MNCKKCGAPLDGSSKFCGVCGEPIETQTETPEIFNVQEPVNQNTVIIEPVQEQMTEPQVQPVEPVPTVEPVQPVEPVSTVKPNIVEPVQPVQPVPTVEPNIVEPVQPVPTVEPNIVEPVQPVEPVSTVEPINMNNGVVPPIETPSFEPTEEYTEKKHSKLPIILILLILLGVGAFCAYKFLFNKPDKVVKGLINKAYDKFESPLKETRKIEGAGESVLVTTDLSINTNIAGLEDLNNIKLNLITGTDYSNKKIEFGASLIEDNTNIIDLFMYILNKDAYMVLKDIYSNPIKINTEDIELEEILKNNISAEDAELVAKEFKNVLIESLDMNDFKKSTDTITLDDKDTKVNKISYILDDAKAKKLVNNIIDNTLKNDKLVNKLAEMINEDVDTFKQDLQDSKIESDDILNGNTIKFEIYTKGLTDEFVGIDIELPENSNIKARKNSDNTTISSNISGSSIILTIKEESKDKSTVDMKITVAGQEITGTATIENKEIDEKNSESKITMSISFQEQTVGLTLNMKQQIGANIADVDITNAKAMEEMTEEEMTMIEQKIMEKLMNSKLYNLIETQMQSTLGAMEEDYSYDYSDLENESL